FNQLEITAIGCTRQSEANRKGRWGILTNNKDRVVTFNVGEDGNIPQPGYVIAVADRNLSGRDLGGRVSAVNGRVLTLDRAPDASSDDRMIVNLPSGVSQSRTIQSIRGNKVTVTTAYSETPVAEAVWGIESDELYAQQYRVITVTDNNDGTFTIVGANHDPDKFDRIDTGAIIDQRPVSVIPPGNQSPPANIVISSFSVVQQNISVETMRVSWDQAQNAIAYEAQWRRNDGNWVNVPRSSTTSFDVPGIYAGRYLVRVRAINAAEISSGWGYSEEKTLTGKVGNPPKPVGFIASENVVFGIELSWGFPANTDDTLKTEIQYSLTGTEDDVMLLADVPFPQRKYQQMGLKAGQIFWYRAQLVDRSGNESGYTEFVRGQASIDVSDITDAILEDMKGSDTFKDLIENAVDSNEKIAGMADDIKQANDELEQQAQKIAQNAQDIGKVQTSVTNLSSKVGDVSSSLNELEQTVATADTALGQRIDNISVSMDGMTGGVKNSAIAIIQGNLAQVAARKTLSASVAGNSAQLDRIDEVIVNEKEATARSLLSLQTDVNGNKASINSLNQTFSDYQQAMATQVNSITATVNGHTSAITTNAQAIANVNGDLKAMYSIKVGLSSNGQYYAAGMGIGVENTPSGMQSQVIFLADRFAVTHQAGATVTLPFVIQNGQTIIRNTVIGDGTIGNAKIGSYIQSSTWDGTGNVGWHINKSGYATFNNVTVRGSIYATNGNFSFNGSGNTTVINGNGVTINIPGGGRIVLGTWT
ncbi:TPA: host specificity protein J, partial [Enterobacter hormaechei subsp. xiangfangensis]